MKFILIGNYPPDKQESMLRFTQMLHHGFLEAGLESEIWQPGIFFGRWAKSPNAGLGKWLGYLDKWLIFKMVLFIRVRRKAYRGGNIRFHVCDHSNAPYLANLPVCKTSITCHDVLAIRGALGYADAFCPASRTGRLLQKWILSHLLKARLLAADTKQTLLQLEELQKADKFQNKWRVIHIAFNAEFKRLDKTSAMKLLDSTPVPPGCRYLLQVGSGITRKNRKLIIDMVAILGKQFEGFICFAGEAADQELLKYAGLKKLEDRIISISKPDHQTLLALYSNCDTLIFPSFSEGFGWPVIEGQACGAPVIASSFEPMPEVSGGAAIHADPCKAEEFAAAWLALKNIAFKNELIQKGFANARRFQSREMIDRYLELHDIERVN